MGICKFLRDHDLPNWISFIATLIIIPSLLWLWTNRSCSSIPGLEITFELGSRRVGGIITGETYSYLNITYSNKTGKLVYLTDCRARSVNRDNIKIDENAVLDVVTRSYELNFVDKSYLHTKPYAILQDDERKKVAIPLSTSYTESEREKLLQDLKNHKNDLRQTKFFNIEYTALVGNKKCKVKFKY